MEKETELYLIEKIRSLENENSYLRGEKIAEKMGFVREKNNEPLSKEQLFNKAFDNQPIFLEQNIEKIFLKAEAFDIIQEILNLAVSNWVEKAKYELYTTKPNIKKNIKIEIDERTFKKLWRVMSE